MKMVITGNSKRQTIAARCFIAGAVLAVLAVGYWVGVPRTYRATAIVRVWMTGTGLTNHPAAPYDPNTTLPQECEVMRSQVVLDPVVSTWQRGGLLGGGSNGPVADLPAARQRLRELIAAQPEADAGIIRVTTGGPDVAQAAALVNAVARSYCAYRNDERAKLSHETVGALDTEATNLNRQIVQAESNLLVMKEKMNSELAAKSANYLTPIEYKAQATELASLKAQLDDQSQQLNQVKSKDGAEFLAAVAKVKGQTNTAFPGLLRQLQLARDRLAAAQAGNDLAAARQAGAAVDDLQGSAQRAAQAVVMGLEGRLASLQAQYDSLSRQLSTVTTNTTEITGTRPGYQQAVDELDQLKDRREALQQRIEADSERAVLPVALSAEIVNEASPNLKPASPSQTLAVSVLAVAALSLLGGLYVKFGGPKTKVQPPSNPRAN